LSTKDINSFVKGLLNTKESKSDFQKLQKLVYYNFVIFANLLSTNTIIVTIKPIFKTQNSS